MERASYFLKLWVPTVIIFLLSNHRGRHHYRCTTTSEVSLTFSKLCAALINYSWPVLCVQFLARAVDVLFFHPCAICMYSFVWQWRWGAPSSVTQEEKRGWMGGGFKRPRGSYPFECCWFVPCCSVWPVLCRLFGIHAEWEVIRVNPDKLCIEMNTRRLTEKDFGSRMSNAIIEIRGIPLS